MKLGAHRLKGKLSKLKSRELWTETKVVQNTEYRMGLLGLTATLLAGRIIRFPQHFPGLGHQLTSSPEPKALTN